jgi:hypothetical protein
MQGTFPLPDGTGTEGAITADVLEFLLATSGLGTGFLLQIELEN